MTISHCLIVDIVSFDSAVRLALTMTINSPSESVAPSSSNASRAPAESPERLLWGGPDELGHAHAPFAAAVES